jgi:hypothetical protein
MCEYILRGLTTPRCPECGYHFSWEEVLDPNRRDHTYLFEHHPERNVSTFLRTAFGSYASGSFWKSLNPVMPSKPGRLAFFFMASSAVFLAALAAECLGSVATVHLWSSNYWGISAGKLIRNYAMGGLRLDVLSYGLPIIAWPLSNGVSLLLFGVTLKRRKLKRIHAMRCAIYALHPMVWLPLLVVAYFADVSEVFSRGARAYNDLISFCLYGCGWLVSIIRLRAALVYYLRIPHAAATAGLVAIVATLGFAVGLLLLVALLKSVGLI